MIVRKRDFNNSYCITEVAINEFINERGLRREHVINIIPTNNGVELWYWDMKVI